MALGCLVLGLFSGLPLSRRPAVRLEDGSEGEAPRLLTRPRSEQPRQKTGRRGRGRPDPIQSHSPGTPAPGNSPSQQPNSQRQAMGARCVRERVPGRSSGPPTPRVPWPSTCPLNLSLEDSLDPPAIPAPKAALGSLGGKRQSVPPPSSQSSLPCLCSASAPYVSQATGRNLFDPEGRITRLCKPSVCACHGLVTSHPPWTPPEVTRT